MDKIPDVKALFDEQSNTISYVVKEPDSTSCAVIDPVMEFDYAAGRLTYASADAIIADIHNCDLTVEWIIETHVHADHLSGAPYLKREVGGKSGSTNMS
jgi:glyoxylase-like metal-dependent hydrolase (beta-lactamase superfamily II)